MKAVAFAPLLAGMVYALPKACHTTTKQVIVPTSTATYLSTHVKTVHATTPEDLGTFTDVVRVSSTKTLETITATKTDCTADDTITVQPKTTVYTSGGNKSRKTTVPNPSNRDRGIHAREDADCTITKTSTTTYGQTYTFAPADETSTYTQFTAFTQATTTTTSSGGTAYAIATAFTTTPGACGSKVNATSPTTTLTTTQDARCAPTALISAAGPGASATGRQYGLSYSERTSSGATYSSNATDASACCQLCVEAEKCAASAWDIRSGECKLSFPVEFGSGDLSCGLGLQAYYGAGPNHPMEPGSGLYVAEVCGSVAFANAKPDDGT